VTVQAPSHAPREPRRPRDSGFAVSLLADLVLPLALCYGLRAAGLGVYVTLLIAAAAPTSLVLIVITNVYYRAAGLYRPDSALYPPLNAPLNAP
jgi:hypothetical protein